MNLYAVLGFSLVMFLWWISQNYDHWILQFRWWLLPEAEKRRRIANELAAVTRGAFADRLYLKDKNDSQIQ